MDVNNVLKCIGLESDDDEFRLNAATIIIIKLTTYISFKF